MARTLQSLTKQLNRALGTSVCINHEVWHFHDTVNHTSKFRISVGNPTNHDEWTFFVADKHSELVRLVNRLCEAGTKDTTKG